MSQDEIRERAFRRAIEVARGGLFDDVKAVLERLGFVFKGTTNPDHWLYYHPDLKGDPLFQYPRNLYRPHGSRRTSDRISKHDQSQAKQMIEALRGRISSPQKSPGDDNEY